MEIRCRHGLLEGQCAPCNGLRRKRPSLEVDMPPEEIYFEDEQEDMEEGGEQE